MVKHTACPSCQQPMHVMQLAGMQGKTVELDLCYPCQGIWFDPQENLRLSPAAIVELFQQLHAHRDTPRNPLAQKMQCPHCRHTLVSGFDVVKTGRYITHRCPQRHGRWSTFSAFMIEKGFVRLLTPAEVNDMAQRIGVIRCSSCGASVDLRTDHACPHCRSAFSLLDPKAVERALEGYARATHVADAHITQERDHPKIQRDNKAHTDFDFDLFDLGLTLVWKILD